nr:MAG TPA: hypothetical protein [Caudoviricetes sp.]
MLNNCSGLIGLQCTTNRMKCCDNYLLSNRKYYKSHQC